jgi:protease I
VKGWNHTEWGDEIPVDVPLDRANAEQYDALLLPGGVMNPDKLRRNPRRSRSSKRSSTRGSRWR